MLEYWWQKKVEGDCEVEKDSVGWMILGTARVCEWYELVDGSSEYVNTWILTWLCLLGSSFFLFFLLLSTRVAYQFVNGVWVGKRWNGPNNWKARVPNELRGELCLSDTFLFWFERTTLLYRREEVVAYYQLRTNQQNNIQTFLNCSKFDRLSYSNSFIQQNNISWIETIFMIK